jgi:hypothetical protein
MVHWTLNKKFKFKFKFKFVFCAQKGGDGRQGNDEPGTTETKTDKPGSDESNDDDDRPLDLFRAIFKNSDSESRYYSKYSTTCESQNPEISSSFEIRTFLLVPYCFFQCLLPCELRTPLK